MILLMGIAGSGKGTQGALLAEQKGYKLVSMGDVLRERLTGAQREHISGGGLLADDEVMTIIDDYLASLPADQEVILDGFPRTIPQAEWLLEQVRAGRFSLNTAIHLVASREAVKARLLKRGRTDDNDAAIEARFDAYEQSTTPLLEWLDNNGVRVLNIDAIRSIEEVNQDIVANLTTQDAASV